MTGKPDDIERVLSGLMGGRRKRDRKTTSPAAYPTAIAGAGATSLAYATILYAGLLNLLTPLLWEKAYSSDQPKDTQWAFRIPFTATGVREAARC